MSRAAKSRLVNALTFARVPLIFSWLGFAVAQEFLGGFWLGAFAVLAMFASGMTDLFDGYLARKWGVVSDLGKLADPLMDKFFYIVAFPALLWQSARQGESDLHTIFLLAFTLLYMMRDTWVTFMRTVGTMYGADVAAMWLGKVRTALSFPGAGWVYMYLAFHSFAPEKCHCAWLASCYFVEALLIVLTVASLVTYTAAYSPYLKKALAHKQDL